MTSIFSRTAALGEQQSYTPYLVQPLCSLMCMKLGLPLEEGGKLTYNKGSQLVSW